MLGLGEPQVELMPNFCRRVVVVGDPAEQEDCIGWGHIDHIYYRNTVRRIRKGFSRSQLTVLSGDQVRPEHALL